MVAIAVQPTPSGLRTVGITGIFSFGLEQIVAFEYLMALVRQLPVPAVQEIAGKDYLVEKVPFPPVLQCPVTSFQRIPPRIIQFFLFHILGITFGSKQILPCS